MHNAFYSISRPLLSISRQFIHICYDSIFISLSAYSYSDTYTFVTKIFCYLLITIFSIV